MNQIDQAEIEWRIFSTELKKFFWRSFLFWPIAISFLMTSFNYFSSRGERPIIDVFLRTLPYTMTIPVVIGIFYSVYYAIVIWRRWHWAYLLKRNIAFNMLFSALATVVGLAIAEVIARILNGGVATHPFDWISSLYIGLVISFAFVALYGYRSMSREYGRLQAKSAESSFHILKNQMQPHFLFNSLNSLSVLIHRDQNRAGEMTQKLSDLYRKILDASKGAMTTLADELEICRLYLDLEKMRFGERLNFEFKVATNHLQILLPSLVLQTLVENAVKHGIAKRISGGVIELTIEDIPNDRCLIQVQNSGGLDHANRGGGVGLRNTKERLDLCYGGSHGFKIETVIPESTRVSFEVPKGLS